MRFMVKKRCYIAGRPVDPCTGSELKELFQQLVKTEQKRVLANLNLHGLYCSFKSNTMQHLLLAKETLVHIDGTPILWLCNFLGAKLNMDYRNAHIDLVPELLKTCAENNLRVFLVGSNKAGAIENEAVLRRLIPGLQIKTSPGYFNVDNASDDKTISRLIDEINNNNTNLLLVGLGMPKQEEWIAANKDRLNVNMIMPVGGFADYFAGRRRIPPRFLGKLGLEWLFRLLEQPLRLGFRYLIEPALLLALLGLNTLKGEKWGQEMNVNR